MNINAPTDAKRLRAQLEARYRGVSRAVAIKVLELSEGGMTTLEIAAHLGLSLPIVNLVKRGGVS
jgi:hypothetical protein